MTYVTKMLVSRLIKSKTNCHDYSLITRLRWVKMNGLKYMPNNAFIISSVVDGEPKFSKLTGFSDRYLKNFTANINL